LGPDIYKDKKLFPDTGVVRMVMDGDTLQVQNGLRIRLIGINAADRGEEKYDQAKVSLRQLVEDKRVWLEYDRYQDDKSGRVLAWIWVGCETTPKFTKPDYMRLSFNRSKEGLTTNPEGCQLGKLVQEELIKQGMAKVETYKDRGELKYQQRISEID
jgi:endonuclease YncB( thermonuclease family)